MAEDNIFLSVDSKGRQRWLTQIKKSNKILHSFKFNFWFNSYIDTEA